MLQNLQNTVTTRSSKTETVTALTIQRTVVSICATGFDINVPALHPKNTCLVLTLAAVRSFTGLDYVDICHVILMLVMFL